MSLYYIDAYYYCHLKRIYGAYFDRGYTETSSLFIHNRHSRMFNGSYFVIFSGISTNIVIHLIIFATSTLHMHCTLRELCVLSLHLASLAFPHNFVQLLTIWNSLNWYFDFNFAILTVFWAQLSQFIEFKETNFKD